MNSSLYVAASGYVVVLMLQKEYEDIAGHSLNLLSDDMTRVDSMLERMLVRRRVDEGYSTPFSEDCVQSVILSSQFEEHLSTFSNENLEVLYWHFMHYPENTKEACKRILDIAGPDIGKSGHDYRTDALFYFYQQDILTDEQIHELKSNKNIMKNQAIKDIFYSKGDKPFLNEMLWYKDKEGAVLALNN